MRTDPPFPWPFGQYELLAELGRGTTGTVYLARHVKVNRAAAIKLPADGASPRAWREVQTQASLMHPHIVSLYDAGVREGQAYITREHVEGADLGECQRTRSIGLQVAMSVLAAVARAVSHMHDRGIVHRTLDASNVLVGRDRRPKLIGFGRAKPMDTAPTTASALIAGDIQALGRILLSGAEQLSEPLPEVFEAIAMKCEAAGSEWGYRSAGEVADALDRFLRG
jgi:serine/threonine-protein kinase